MGKLRPRLACSLVFLSGISLCILVSIVQENSLLFVSPFRITDSLSNYVFSPLFFSDLLSTIGRASLGLLFACLIAIPTGLVLGLNQDAFRLIDPFISAFFPLPKILILPFLILILGLSDLSAIFLVTISAFFPILVSTIRGIQEIDKNYFELAKSLGAQKLLFIKKIVLPGSMPSILNGVRIGGNTALLMAIVSEMLISTNGIGYRIWFAWQTLNIANMYSVFIVIVMLGLLANLVLLKIASLLTPWNPVGANNYPFVGGP